MEIDYLQILYFFLVFCLGFWLGGYVCMNYFEKEICKKMTGWDFDEL